MRLSVSCFEKDNEKKTKLIQHDIEFIIKILNSVESIIEDYASKKHAVEELQAIYQFLEENFPAAPSTSTIMKPYKKSYTAYQFPYTSMTH